MARSPKFAILHVALNPVTGVWSVMRDVAAAQARSGLYAEVGTAVVADKNWPDLCRAELGSSGRPHYLADTPRMFGTAQDLWQRARRPPIAEWIDDVLRRAGTDDCVVHFHNAWISGVFMPLPRLSQGCARAVATFHGVNAHFRRQPGRQAVHRWMAHRLLRHGAALTSVDRGNLNRAEALLGMPRERFKVIPNGVPDTTLRACPRLRGGEGFTVGHVGSITPAKGWRFLVEAARLLRDRGLPVRVVLAGSGPEAPEAIKAAESNPDWLSYKGFVANPRETVMNGLDALVLMSEQEGLPMAIIEAMSLGLPVVATPVGGVPEAVTDGGTGFLVDRSVAGLAAALERLISDSTLHAKVATQARKEFEARFEISRVVAGYHSVYEGRL